MNFSFSKRVETAGAEDILNGKLCFLRSVDFIRSKDI